MSAFGSYKPEAMRSPEDFPEFDVDDELLAWADRDADEDLGQTEINEAKLDGVSIFPEDDEDWD